MSGTCPTEYNDKTIIVVRPLFGLDVLQFAIYMAVSVAIIWLGMCEWVTQEVSAKLQHIYI